MAGGKETPRQKLIGLMYLVLLAMLALNVSADIMNKFYQMNNSLETFVKGAESNSKQTLAFFEAKVAENKDREDEVKALKKAKEVNQKSKKIIDYINGLKTQLIEGTGGYENEDGTGKPQGLKDNDFTSTLLVGSGESKGEAYELEKKLDEYVIYLNEMAKFVADAKNKKRTDSTKTIEPITFDNLALDGKEDDLFKDADANIRNQDFAHLNFDHTPMVASMAFLTDKAARVAAYETTMLNEMKGLLGLSDIKFDKIIPMFKAESQTVVSGNSFKANLFVSAVSENSKPKFEILSGGGKVDGIGNYEISGVTPGGKDGKKSFVYKIEVPGQDPLIDTGYYYVVTPVLKVSAGDIAALYRGCGNPLDVSCPALGANFNPSYSTKGGSLRKGKEKGKVIIYPSQREVAMTVTSGGRTIGTEKFKVKKIPLPTIEVRPNGRKMTAAQERTGLSAPPRSISVVAVPDAGFKSALPSEANYYVTKWTAILVRGKRPVGGALTMNKTKGDVSRLRSKAKTGDRILVEVKNVIRKNSLGKSEGVSVGLIVKNITF